jgi:hypothetical protein
VRKFLNCVGLEEERGTMGQAQINSLKTVRNGALTCWHKFCKMFEYHLLFVKQNRLLDSLRSETLWHHCLSRPLQMETVIWYSKAVHSDSENLGVL